MLWLKIEKEKARKKLAFYHCPNDAWVKRLLSGMGPQWHENLFMNFECFAILFDTFIQLNLLQSRRVLSINELLAIFLYMLAYNLNRVTKNQFNHSGKLLSLFS